MLRKKLAVILSVSEGSRVATQKISCHPERQRRIPCGYAWRPVHGILRRCAPQNDRGEWGGLWRTVKPPLKGEVLSEAKRRGLASLA